MKIVVVLKTSNAWMQYGIRAIVAFGSMDCKLWER